MYSGNSRLDGAITQKVLKSIFAKLNTKKLYLTSNPEFTSNFKYFSPLENNGNNFKPFFENREIFDVEEDALGKQCDDKNRKRGEMV